MKIRIIMLLLVVLLFTFCKERDLSTPADRIIGHWTTKMNDDLYFSGINSDGFGSYILVQTNGHTGHHKYKIVSQDSTGESLVLQLIFSNEMKRQEEYVIAQDGKKLINTAYIIDIKTTSNLEYVDNKTEP